MTNTPPGMKIFGREWFDTYLTDCPESLRPAVERICAAFDLGDTTTPNIIAKLINEGLLEAFKHRYFTSQADGAIQLTDMAIDEEGDWTFYGVDPTTGDVEAFKSEHVSARIRA